jgi:hypothetical protein
MSKIYLGQLVNSKYILQVESWIKKKGGVSRDKLDLPCKIFKDTLTDLDLDFYNKKKDILCMFTPQWEEYFISLRIRVHKIPLYLLLEFTQFYGLRTAFTITKAESLLLNFKWADRLDTRKIRHIKETKNWMCWEPVYEEDYLDEYRREELVGYSFQEDLWKALESIYSFASGTEARRPTVQNFYEIGDPRKNTLDSIYKIEKYV